MIGTTVSRYRILSRLGGGGMGVVYEAEDTELGRRVAIKFLPEETAAAPDAVDRFKREARAASALNHPHICTVYDVGVHEGRPFLVMERMQGATLKHVLEGKRLPVERVVALGEQIADALEAAHRAGIVHRDLKPANLFVTEHGEVKVLDFGLAKWIAGDPDSVVTSDGATVVEQQLTMTGTTVGTVSYMSPEQARGESLDARSDLFSLGVVLYEMATGRLPFPGETAAESYAAILRSDPVPPGRHDPGIPQELERVILECLEKDPALRYQTAGGVRADLKRLLRDRGITSGSTSGGPVPSEERPSKASVKGATPASRLGVAIGIAAALVAIALAGFWIWKARGGEERAATVGGAPPAGPKRIAVLPFENLGAAEDAYFAEGMADEVRGKISGLPGLAVIARASSNDYRGTAKKLDEIADELDVRYLLTGTVRWQKSGGANRVRLAPELVEIAGDAAPTTRWQETFDAELADVFAVQASIAGEVARALELALGGDEAERLAERPTSNLAAYDAFLRARGIASRGVDVANQKVAAAQLELAVEADPRFAAAWALLGATRSLIYSNGELSAELAADAKRAVDTALTLAPRLPEAHWALGSYNRLVARDSGRALAALRDGLALAPDHPDLLRNLGNVEQLRGNLREALAAQRRAAELDPRSGSNQYSLAITLLLMHRPREARVEIDRGLEIAPGFIDLVARKLQSYVQEGDLAGARAALASRPAAIDATTLAVSLITYYDFSWVYPDSERDRLLRLTPADYENNRARWAESLARANARIGDAARARELAEEARSALVEQVRDTPSSTILLGRLGTILAILGRREEATQSFERALELAPSGVNEWDRSIALQAFAVAQVRLGQHEAAIDRLEELLEAPWVITPGWLRIDPTYDSLRGNPRFEKLISEKP